MMYISERKTIYVCMLGRSYLPSSGIFMERGALNGPVPRAVPEATV